MIVDTSALLALFNTDEVSHEGVRALLESTAEQLVVSPYVLAELDYLVASRFGVPAELEVLREMGAGAWTLSALSADDLGSAARIVEKYSDQAIGVADASIVVLAERHRTRTVATLDRRHFEVLRPLQGGRFTIVP